ncbi:MAG TPA: N(4)-(beta-N-acetylglucosaminyl)-L-asparaginase [Armatimonadota bacterium]|nr:N(4)-(beta-N-acetylglucosaminyl)-L-asparaginase [Armatimonadota bacterium]
MEPKAIATWDFGMAGAEEAHRRMTQGASALDAVEAGIRVVELDFTVRSVGYGGLPNADGEVELDAAIMDGTGHRAGSVAALKEIRNPISVARSVMDRSPHVMLVGDGALRFALEHGFKQQPTLTEAAREMYDDWVRGGKRRRWLGGADPGDEANPTTSDLPRSHDTVGLAALDADGRIAVGCSTSGLAFKYPGRVGDSPLIGAGLYVDEGAGAATATGVGELILRFSLSHLVVEAMRAGQSPQEACEAAILRLVSADRRYRELQVGVIALGMDGRTGAASTRPPEHALRYTVVSAEGVAVLDAVIPLQD